MSKRSSPVWDLSKEDLQILFDNSSSISEVLLSIGLINHGSNFRTLKRRTEEDKIDLHLFNINKSKTKIIKRRPNHDLTDVLVENSTYSRHALKKRLLSSGKLENKCYDCGIGAEYNNKPLSLQLDHINGISNDNRLENLRFLCPNCHSQTESFAGKKRKSL